MEDHNGSDLETNNQRLKRPCASLFGGLFGEAALQQMMISNSQDNNEPDLPEALGSGPGIRLYSLDIEQQEHGNVISNYIDNPMDGLNPPRSCHMSTRASPALSEASILIPPDDKPSYDLRQNIERNKVFTYFDNDKSGNFDPDGKTRHKTFRANKPKPIRTGLKKGKKRLPVPKVIIQKGIVRLQFKTFGNVRNRTNDEDNWPDNWSDTDCNVEDGAKGFHNIHQSITPGTEIQEIIEDPAGELDDLTGHPVARSCKTCRKLHYRCSMVQDGKYPCDQCAELKRTCVPIVPPSVKISCKQCIGTSENYCSFENDPRQETCEECIRTRKTCEPVPPGGYRSDRVFIDEIMYGEGRPYISCTVCRQEGRRCSLKNSKDSPPCKYCKKHEIECTFLEVPPSGSLLDHLKSDKTIRSSKKDASEIAVPSSDYFTTEDLADMEMRDDESVLREETPDVEMEDSEGRKGNLIRITTSFAHPMEFDVASNNNHDCNFCDIAWFGITGHFEREVHVIRWHNGLGYSEIGGGHCEEFGATKMCHSCSLDRLQILVCPGHEIRPISLGHCPDFEEAAAELLACNPGSTDFRDQIQRWCSFCFSVAESGCDCPQPSLYNEGNLVEGCGLRLCGRCEMSLREHFASDIDSMINELCGIPKLGIFDDHDACWHGKPRADVSLLQRDGLLMRNV